MQLELEFEPIREWATNKGIYAKGDPKTQTLKLVEEAGELAKAVLNNEIDEVEDAIGDCVVVLTSIAKMYDLTIEQCINSAYQVIAKRSGRMENGTFIKDK